MLGNTLVTIQTGPEGKKVKRVLVEQGMNIARELYIALTLDRATGRNTVVASTEGGMDIEEVAAHSPEKILNESIDPAVGLQAFQARKLALRARPRRRRPRPALRQVPARARGRLRPASTCALLEVNPLVVTKGGDQVLALDSQDLLRRQLDSSATRSSRRCADHDRGGRQASSRPRAGTSAYIELDGTIGCMVNGAGLAMATLDIIKLRTAPTRPTSSDVGGGATEEKVTAAFKIITADPKVKGILVNIFGGIMKCDVDRHAACSRRSRRSASRSRWWCASKAPTSSKARRCIRRERAQRSSPADEPATTPPPKIVKAVKEAA